MKRIQQISLLIAALACLYIAYIRYFSYGWRSPVILVALSIVLLFQVWELERPEKELTMNELMEQMQQNQTEKHPWYQKHFSTFGIWFGILFVAIWLKSNLLIITAVISIFSSLVQVTLEHHEEAKKQAEVKELMKKIDELKGDKDEA